MNREDLTKLMGSESAENEYLPVAFLLRNGYACAGYFHSGVNEGMQSTCVLLNANVIELQRENKTTGRPTINDFNEFLEEVVVDLCRTEGEDTTPAHKDVYGKSIPLTAIPFDEISVVYPVAHISELMRRVGEIKSRLPTFLDLNKSEILRLLGTKLW